MKTAIQTLQYVAAAGFVLVALVATRQWVRTRHRRTAYLALATLLLGVVSVLGRINETTDYEHPLISDISLVGFLGSGYFFLMFRHGFVPLSFRVRLAALVALIGTSVAAVVVQLPSGPDPDYDTSESIVLTLIVALWSICVGEPIYRFWKESFGRPVVQRARLRALSVAYGTIIVILVAAISIQPEQGSIAELVIQIAAVGLIPLLLISVSPPGWLRRAWRHREEEDLRLTQDLLMFAPDRGVLAQRALQWAMRLTGASSGCVFGPHHELLACVGVAEDEIEDITEDLTDTAQPQMVHLDEPAGYAIAVPLRSEEGTGRLVVFSGPFVFLFGEDEVERLKMHATAIGVALDRVRLTEELRRLDKVKSEFISNAAHELRTPLTAIVGLSSAMAMRHEEMTKEALAGAFDVLDKQAQRMRRLINDLLDLSQIEQGRARLELQPVRLDSTLHHIVDALPPDDRDRLRVEVQNDVMVLADPGRLDQVVTNLLTNAFLYGGQNVILEANRDDGSVVLTVSDDGSGVPKDLQSRLFEPFVRGSDHSEAQGSGLGLAIVQGLIEAFGGSIRYEDRDPRGASFVVELKGAG